MVGATAQTQVIWLQAHAANDDGRSSRAVPISSSAPGARSQQQVQLEGAASALRRVFT